ncbi:MAG: hypothetical protein WC980_01920 [Candidatus Brocadiia bacterium]
MKRILLFAIIICVCLCPSVVSYADTDWQSLKTERFEVFYKTGYEAKAREVLTVLTAYRDNIKKLTGNEIPRLRVVIENLGTMSNAMADPMAPNIHIYAYPPDPVMGGMPGVGFGENWPRMAGIHESIHLAQLTQSSGFPGILTTAFGNVFSPNLVVPGWITEGVTVSGESQISPYEGRVNDGFFKAVMDAYTQTHPFPTLLEMTYTPLNLPSLAGGHYLYGGLFLDFLRQKYGQEKLNAFFQKQGESFFGWLIGWLAPSAGIDHSAKEVFGKTFPELWQEWQNSYSYRRFAIDGSPVTDNRLALYSDLSVESNFIYYIERTWRKADTYRVYSFERICRRGMTTKEEEELASTTSSFNTKPCIAGNNLYYTVLEMKPGFANSTNQGFGLVSNLHCKDMATRKDRIIFSDTIRAFTVLPASAPMTDGATTGVQILYTKDRAEGFGSDIYAYDQQSGQHKMLFSSDYLVGQLTAGQNIIVASARLDWENWGIYLLDINNSKLEELVNTPYAETSPSIMNNRIFFTANYDRTYRIYAYDLGSKKTYKVTQGSFAHFPAGVADEVYFVGLSGDSTNIYSKPAVYDEFKLPQPEQSKLPDLDKISAELNPDKGGYFSVLKTAVPYFRFPVLDPKGQGALLVGNDVTYEHFYAMSFRSGQDPRLHLIYENRMFQPLTLGLEVSRKSGTQDTSLYGNYPLYRRLEPGLSYVTPSLALRQDETSLLDHTELVPGIGAGLKYPKWQLQSQFNYIAERKSWSEASRDGAEMTAVFARYFDSLTKGSETGSEFRMITYLLNDPDRARPQELEIRGFRGDDALTTNRGGTLTLEYGYPVYKNSGGSWGVNFYWGDISVAYFTDMAFSKNSAPDFSAGAEVRMEAALGYGLRFVPTIGLAVPNEGKNELYLGLMISSAGMSGLKKP